MPVPTAVPPSATSDSSAFAWSSLRRERSICAAYPRNSWPSRTGVASWRWVLPVLMMGMNSSALRSNSRWSFAIAGARSSSIALSADMCMAVGMTSLDD